MLTKDAERVFEAGVIRLIIIPQLRPLPPYVILHQRYTAVRTSSQQSPPLLSLVFLIVEIGLLTCWLSYFPRPLLSLPLMTIANVHVSSAMIYCICSPARASRRCRHEPCLSTVPNLWFTLCWLGRKSSIQALGRCCAATLILRLTPLHSIQISSTSLSWSLHRHTSPEQYYISIYMYYCSDSLVWPSQFTAAEFLLWPTSYLPHTELLARCLQTSWVGQS